MPHTSRRISPCAWALTAVLTVASVGSCGNAAEQARERSEQTVKIRGTYGHPKSFWQKNARLDDYGVNAVFIHGKSIDEATFARAKSEGCKVFAEFATLNGKYGDYVQKHPDAHPVDDSGNPAAPATWFMGVCPTHEGFREYRMQALRELLTRHELDGVWMDYLHWHAQFEDPYPVFIKTCFSASCIDAFQEWADLEVQGQTVPEKAKCV